jgi:hypothetical protein
MIFILDIISKFKRILFKIQAINTTDANSSHLHINFLNNSHQILNLNFSFI